MENQEQNSANLFELQFDENAKAQVKTMASWALIIVVTSVIGYVLAIVKHFMPQSQFETFLESDEYGGGPMGGAAKNTSLVGTIISILIGLVITYFLYMFATKAKKGMEGLSQYDVNVGFSYFRNYFLIIGILLIILLVFMLVIGIGAGLLAGSMR